MFKNTDKHILTIIILYVIIQAAYLITEYRIAGGTFGAPLDDVWIHFRFAENFAHGYLYQYNPGEPTPGTTSPLWVIILSIPFLFSQNFIVPYALFISSVFFLLALIQLYKLCLKLGFEGIYSLFITLITMFAGRLLWSSLSGMEITLFVLLSILIVSNHIKEISTGKVLVINGLLLGLAANTRPETYLFAGLYYLTTIYLLRKNLKINLTKLFLSLLVFAVLVLPYPVFSFVHTGGFLPNTYEGQVGTVKYLPNFTYITESAKIFIKDNFIVFILWGISAGYFILSVFKKKIENNFLLINLWIFLLPLVSAFIASNWRHHGRYLIPLIPFINIIAIYILRKLHRYYEEKGYRRYTVFRKGTIAVILIASINSAVMFAGVLGWNVENINNQQGKIADWLNENLPGEKAFGMNDIGIITFKTKKYVVDMAGLVTPEVFKFQKMSYEDGTKELFRYLKSKGVNYIIIYPDWFWYIMSHYSGVFTQVHSQKLQKNTICGGIEMFVYKINWDKISL
ncbi:MAG: hypothetical protein UZ05_CHB002000379 [Chlorobi bacterium OLB5]|nr:MAG: hypothetical protein UZ05_CHB002000379 [Chlorobi bacterium OLB5]